MTIYSPNAVYFLQFRKRILTTSSATKIHEVSIKLGNVFKSIQHLCFIMNNLDTCSAEELNTAEYSMSTFIKDLDPNELVLSNFIREENYDD